MDGGLFLPGLMAVSRPGVDVVGDTAVRPSIWASQVPAFDPIAIPMVVRYRISGIRGAN